MQKSVSLEYEPVSEPLHIPVEKLFLISLELGDEGVGVSVDPKPVIPETSTLIPDPGALKPKP